MTTPNSPGSLSINTKAQPNTRTALVRTYWLLGLAIIVGAVARLVLLGSHSLLLDEGFVAVGARDMLRNHTPMWDAISNAPFVWMVAHLIGLGGLSNDTLVRLPSALFGIASIPLVYALALRLSDRRTASISALFFALHPFAVAFSRVLFADTFQVFFILLGFIAFDRYATRRDSLRNSTGSLFWLILIWAAAFLMKYNAVVPGALWLIAGAIAGRYRISLAAASFVAMTLGALATLAIWPYDAPIWLAAFLDKGGNYDILWAAKYYFAKLHLVMFFATELVIIAAIVIAIGRRSKALAQLALFVILYFVTIVLLGRTFERYLLVLVPIACMLTVQVVIALFGESSRYRVIARSIRVVVSLLVLVGVWQSYHAYGEYLSNDIDRHALTRSVLNLEQRGARGYWLVSEPTEAYYLGFTQHYSRAVRPGLDGELAQRNYFEWSSLPYSEEWRSYGVLSARQMARRWGLARIIAHPYQFRDRVLAITQADNALPRTPPLDYFTSDSLRHGDVLVMESGVTDVQGEPILESVSAESTPPYFRSLPLDRFSVYQCYRPEGLSTPTDTRVFPTRAGGWVLEKK